MSNPKDDPVVITGCGWVCPVAVGNIREVLSALRGAAPPATPQSGYLAIPDEVLARASHLADELKRDRSAWVPAVALERACAEAKIAPGRFPSERVGMVLGAALAGQWGMIAFADEVRQQSARFVSPIHFPQTVGNYVAGALARAYDIRGPNVTLSSGVAAGLDAMVEAISLLNSGSADVMFAGGADTLSPPLATGLSEPGVALSEGACWFVLERTKHAAARGAAPLAVVRGTRQEGSGAEEAPRRESAVLSAAPRGGPGSIVIEHWVGRCFAALGSAAVAAAIGAVRGLAVPWLIVPDPLRVSAGEILPTNLPTVDGGVRVIVNADAGGGHRSVLELAVPLA